MPTDRRSRAFFASPQWLFLPALIFLALFWIVPVVPGLLISCQESLPGADEAKWVGLQNYRELLGEDRFQKNVLLTLTYLAGVLVLTTPVAYLSALVISRRARLLGPIRGLLLIPWVVPPVVSALIFKSMADPEIGPLAMVYQGLSGDRELIPLLSPFWAMATVILHSFWRSVPVMTLFLAAGMTTIPDSFHEAAQVDGATPWQRFWWITLPLTRGHLATGLLLISAFTLQDAETIYALTDGGPGYDTEVVAVRLFQEAFKYQRYHTGAAVGTILLIMGLVLMGLYLRAFRRAEATV